MSANAVLHFIVFIRSECIGYYVPYAGLHNNSGYLIKSPINRVTQQYRLFSLRTHNLRNVSPAYLVSSFIRNGCLWFYGKPDRRVTIWQTEGTKYRNFLIWNILCLACGVHTALQLCLALLKWTLKSMPNEFSNRFDFVVYFHK